MDQLFTVPKHEERFCQVLRDMWLNGMLCDAAIEVGSRVLKAHKLVLAVGSPVFSNMATNLPDNAQLLIQLPVETDVQALECVITFLYTGEITLTKMTSEMIQQLAQLFKIETLTEFCNTYQNKAGSTPKRRKNAGKIKSSEVSEVKTKVRKESTPKKLKVPDINVPDNKIGLRSGGSSGLKLGVKPTRRGRGLQTGRGRGSRTATNVQTTVSAVLKTTGIKLLTSGIGVARGRGRGRGSKRGYRRGSRRGATHARNLNLKQEDIECPEAPDGGADGFVHSPANSSAVIMSDSDIEDMESNYMTINDNDTSDRTWSTYSRSPSSSKRGYTSGGKSRAEIQKAYRERKLATMSPEDREKFRAKESLRTRMRSAAIRGPSYRDRGRRRVGEVDPSLMSMETMLQNIKQEPDTTSYDPQSTVKPPKNIQAWRMRKYRERKHLKDPNWKYKERIRIRNRYIPLSMQSEEKREEIRQKNRLHTAEYRKRKQAERSDGNTSAVGGMDTGFIINTALGEHQSGSLPDGNFDMLFGASFNNFSHTSTATATNDQENETSSSDIDDDDDDDDDPCLAFDINNPFSAPNAFLTPDGHYDHGAAMDYQSALMWEDDENSMPIERIVANDDDDRNPANNVIYVETNNSDDEAEDDDRPRCEDGQDCQGAMLEAKDVKQEAVEHELHAAGDAKQVSESDKDLNTGRNDIHVRGAAGHAKQMSVMTIDINKVRKNLQNLGASVNQTRTFDSDVTASAPDYVKEALAMSSDNTSTSHGIGHCAMDAAIPETSNVQEARAMDVGELAKDSTLKTGTAGRLVETYKHNGAFQDHDETSVGKGSVNNEVDQSCHSVIDDTVETRTMNFDDHTAENAEYRVGIVE